MEYAYTSPYAASGGSLGRPVALFLFFLDNEIMKWKLGSGISVDEQALVDQNIHDFPSWSEVLRGRKDEVRDPSISKHGISMMATWLDELFGKRLQQYKTHEST